MVVLERKEDIWLAREAIPELFTHFVLFFPGRVLGQGFQGKVQGQQLFYEWKYAEIYNPPVSASFTICYFQLKKLEMAGFSQFYLINCAALQKRFVFELQLTRNKHSQGRAQKLQNNSLPFYCDANVAQCTKSLLLLQLHRVTYLVNFHSKQSQKSTSRFIPPLHFLEEMWIAITVLSQKKKNLIAYILFQEITMNAFFQCIPYITSTE